MCLLWLDRRNAPGVDPDWWVRESVTSHGHSTHTHTEPRIQVAEERGLCDFRLSGTEKREKKSHFRVQPASQPSICTANAAALAASAFLQLGLTLPNPFLRSLLLPVEIVARSHHCCFRLRPTPSRSRRFLRPTNHPVATNLPPPLLTSSTRTYLETWSRLASLLVRALHRRTRSPLLAVPSGQHRTGCQ